MEKMISMKNINKSYKMGQETLHVLKDINLDVEKGEYLAILGPSGSGKSTLMNIIGCMDTADDGEYFLNGEPIHTMHEKDLTQLRNRQIGFIFQKYHLIPKYNVVQNIIMPLLVRGESHRDAEKMCAETIRTLGLQDRLKHKPTELSGGQQQRVAIARALVGNPAILLADEPTGALDSNTGKELLGVFKQLNSLGNTIIVITHDLNVAGHAKRIVKIIDGELYA
ncbi:MAG: ABC transporter ATP-binding protein [Eubacteriales bacterium]